MLFLFDIEGGRKFVLPLVCVVGLALGTLITGVLAAQRGTPFWLRTFWSTMTLFLCATAVLIGVLSNWIYALVLLLPATLFLFLFRAGRKER